MKEKLKNRFVNFCKEAVNIVYPKMEEEVKTKVSQTIQNTTVDISEIVKVGAAILIFSGIFGNKSGMATDDASRVVNITYNEIHAINYYLKEDI